MGKGGLCPPMHKLVKQMNFYFERKIQKWKLIYKRHPHYKNFDTDLEIFYEKDEYNVGKPLSVEKNRVIMRSDSNLEDIYDFLGYPPCAEGYGSKISLNSDV